MTKEQGFFITFEGADGCGKTSMSQRLCAHLQKMGCPALWTREPGGKGDALSEKIRSLVLDHAPDRDPKNPAHKTGGMDARTETLLFAADRSHHVSEVILPALERGEVVICDRFTDSTLAYQGGGRGLDAGELGQINNFASFGLRPDITFFLRVPLEIARERRGIRGGFDRIEMEEKAFFERVYAFYDGLALADPGRIITIDASPGPDEVWEQ
ncbi:MAG: dTMP kinase, partial [Clostridiales bacterium]|nr:dTMP kinase [Clostridiales bacterium]